MIKKIILIFILSLNSMTQAFNPFSIFFPLGDVIKPYIPYITTAIIITGYIKYKKDINLLQKQIQCIAYERSITLPIDADQKFITQREHQQLLEECAKIQIGHENFHSVSQEIVQNHNQLLMLGSFFDQGLKSLREEINSLKQQQATLQRQQTAINQSLSILAPWLRIQS